MHTYRSDLCSARAGDCYGDEHRICATCGSEGTRKYGPMQTGAIDVSLRIGVVPYQDLSCAQNGMHNCVRSSLRSSEREC